MQDQQRRHAGERDAMLEEAAQALAAANEEIQRCRSSERRLESILVGVLAHVPVPLVVVDEELSVRACSDAARPHGVRPGAALDPPLADSVARAIKTRARKPQRASAAGEGWHVASLGESDDVQAVLWHDPGSC